MYSPELLAAYAARPAWKTWLAHSACILPLGLPYLLSKWSIGLHLWLWYQLCHPQHATALLVQVKDKRVLAQVTSRVLKRVRSQGGSAAAGREGLTRVVSVEERHYIYHPASQHLERAWDEAASTLQDHTAQALEALSQGHAPRPMSAEHRAELRFLCGPNSMPQTWSDNLWLTWLRCITHPFMLLLLGAAGLWFYDVYYEFAAIVVVVCFSTLAVMLTITYRLKIIAKQEATQVGTVKVLLAPPTSANPLSNTALQMNTPRQTTELTVPAPPVNTQDIVLLAPGSTQQPGAAGDAPSNTAQAARTATDAAAAAQQGGEWRAVTRPRPAAPAGGLAAPAMGPGMHSKQSVGLPGSPGNAGSPGKGRPSFKSSAGESESGAMGPLLTGRRARRGSQGRGMAVSADVNNAAALGMAWVAEVDMCELVPGDVVILDSVTVPADMLLIQGECIVDESSTTGENHPLHRSAVPTPFPGGPWSEIPSDHCLMHGTTLLATSGSVVVPLLAVVTRTGGDSSRGAMLREMQRAVAVQHRRLHTQGLVLLAAFLVMFFCFFGYDYWLLVSEYAPYDLAIMALDTLFVTVPPAFVTCLLLIATCALVRVGHEGVHVEDVRRLPLAGTVDTVCVDKTGTITSPEAAFQHLVPVSDGMVGTALTNPAEAPLEFKVLMATCHDLVVMGEEVKGHPVDLALFEAGGWTLNQEGTAPLGGGGGGMAACEPGHTHTPSLLPNHNHKQQKQSSAAALHSEWGEPPTGLVHKDSTSLMPRKSLASLIRPHSVSKLSFSSSQQDTDGAIGGLLATFDAEADGCVRDLSQISTVDNDMVRYPSSNRQTNTTALTTTSNHPHTDTDTLRWSQNPIAALESDETDTTRVGSNSSLGVPTDLGAHFGDGGAPASLRHPSNGNVLGMAPTLPQIQEEDGQFSATHSTVNDNTVTDAPKTGSRVLSKTQSDLATGLRAARGAHASGDGVGGEASGGVNGASEGQAAASTAVPAPRARRRVAFRTLSEKDIAPHVADAGPASASDASAAAAVKEPSTAPLAMAKSAAAMSSGGNSYTSPRESSDGGARVTPTRATRSTCGPEGLEQGPTTPTASQQRALTKAKSHRFAEAHMAFVTREHLLIPGEQSSPHGRMRAHPYSNHNTHQRNSHGGFAAALIPATDRHSVEMGSPWAQAFSRAAAHSAGGYQPGVPPPQSQESVQHSSGMLHRVILNPSLQASSGTVNTQATLAVGLAAEDVEVGVESVGSEGPGPVGPATVMTLVPHSPAHSSVPRLSPALAAGAEGDPLVALMSAKVRHLIAPKAVALASNLPRVGSHHTLSADSSTSSKLLSATQSESVEAVFEETGIPAAARKLPGLVRSFLGKRPPAALAGGSGSGSGGGSFLSRLAQRTALTTSPLKNQSGAIAGTVLPDPADTLWPGYPATEPTASYTTSALENLACEDTRTSAARTSRPRPSLLTTAPHVMPPVSPSRPSLISALAHGGVADRGSYIQRTSGQVRASGMVGGMGAHGAGPGGGNAAYMQLIRQLASQRTSQARLPDHIQVNCAAAYQTQDRDSRSQIDSEGPSRVMSTTSAWRTGSITGARAGAYKRQPSFKGAPRSPESAGVGDTSGATAAIGTPDRASETSSRGLVSGALQPVPSGGLLTSGSAVSDSVRAVALPPRAPSLTLAGGLEGMVGRTASRGSFGNLAQSLRRALLLGGPANAPSSQDSALGPEASSGSTSGFKTAGSEDLVPRQGSRLSSNKVRNSNGSQLLFSLKSSNLGRGSRDRGSENRASKPEVHESSKPDTQSSGNSFMHGRGSTGFWNKIHNSRQSRPSVNLDVRPATFTVAQVWAHPGPDVPAHFKFNIVHRFPFSSSEQRCSVVVDQPGGNLVLYIKGAPERVLELCDPSSIPEDIYEHFDAAQRPGCIVLAVACKVLADTRPEYLSLYTRTALETGAEFLGFVVLENQMRGNSAEVLQEIKAGGIRPIIVTGDGVRSSMQVAMQAGIVPSTAAVLWIDYQGSLSASLSDPLRQGPAAVKSKMARFGTFASLSGAADPAPGAMDAPSSPGGLGSSGDHDKPMHSASGLDGGASKGANKSSGDGLTFRFVQGSVSQTLDLAHATKLLQRHRVRCCVSGSAFTALTSSAAHGPLLALVLRSAMAFGSMQPHMKRELVELLGSPSSEAVPLCHRLFGHTLGAWVLTLGRALRRAWGGLCGWGQGSDGDPTSSLHLAEQGQAGLRTTGAHKRITELKKGQPGKGTQKTGRSASFSARSNNSIREAALRHMNSGKLHKIVLDGASGRRRGGAGGGGAEPQTWWERESERDVWCPLPGQRHAQGVYQRRRVAYCGDGANDLAALKSAMVGVSVAGGMGSLAAPIVMPDTGGLEGLRTLLLHGRATLGTMLTMAQFMMVYAFIQAFSQVQQYFFALNLGTYQFLFQDLMYATLTAAAMGLTPAPRGFIPQRMTLTVLSVRMLLPVMVLWGIAVATMRGAMLMLYADPWYQEIGPPEDYESASELGNYAISRPETAVVFLSSLSMLLGASLSLNLVTWSLRRAAVLRNKWLLLLWTVQAGFLLYLLWAPTDAFKHYGPRGPGVADLPFEFRWRLSLLLMGVVAAQQLVPILFMKLVEKWVLHWRSLQYAL